MTLDQLSPYVRLAKTNVNRGLTTAFVDPEYVMSYIKDGAETYLLENVKHSAQPGSLVLMPPYMLHIINTEQGAPVTEHVIHFDLFAKPERLGPVPKDPEMSFKRKCGDASDPETLLCAVPNVVPCNHADRHFVEALFLKMKSEFESKGELSSLALKASMLELLCFYLSRIPSSKGLGKAARPKVWTNLERAIKFIHSGFRRPLSIREIAREACLSPNYFCALFKDYTDISVHQYLNAVRIDEARRLIEEGSMNFTQIASETGFPSIHLFSRIFKRQTGMTPTEYLGRGGQRGS